MRKSEEERRTLTLSEEERRTLTLSEIFSCNSRENLAFKGTATQSSTYSIWTAQRAIDGVKNGGDPYTSSFCSATSYESKSWWRLDLQDYYDISTVIITARPDCCLDQTSGAEIRVGNSLENNGNNNTM
ncbi:hypothetical protein E1301_Tti008710 [Triplophysa tibetana]|uniref:Fucolectin tachylectin-4 pentraxin-1 domain-containing protein n=1 Tax=Triplophysa tibetana TaxID=1572043 RepID=A0A5A9PKX4_9TELE|nr:hypothetical protein E1301_Tti008710 [Triplophysa tibetana]